jgi:hypothetical protein
MLQQTTLLDVAEAVGRIRRETLRGCIIQEHRSGLVQSASNTILFMVMDSYKYAFAAAVCGGAS